jgi:predicted DNA-binding protein YlxM (UPF0122 family)
MEFKRKYVLLNELILVDGLGRSGKVMLAEIITGFERVEKQNFNVFLEYITLAYKYGKIEKDMAISILKTQFDTELYNNMIGRSVNTRLTDYTSLYKYHSPEVYLKRQLDVDGPIIAEKVNTERPICLNWCHDMIQKSELIFEAFNEKVKLIYINRNPIDIIYEWDQKKFGDRIARDSTEMQYTIKYMDTVVPELAYGWEEEYLKINSMDRIIKMIYVSFKRNLEALKNTNYRTQILVQNFEDIVTEPDISIHKIEKFINSRPLDCIHNILQKERCPRVLDQYENKIRENNIRSQASKKYSEYIDDTKNMHNQIKQFI